MGESFGKFVEKVLMVNFNLPTTRIVKVTLAVNYSAEIFGEVNFDQNALVQIALYVDHFDQSSVVLR